MAKDETASIGESAWLLLALAVTLAGCGPQSQQAGEAIGVVRERAGTVEAGPRLVHAQRTFDSRSDVRLFNVNSSSRFDYDPVAHAIAMGDLNLDGTDELVIASNGGVFPRTQTGESMPSGILSAIAWNVPVNGDALDVADTDADNADEVVWGQLLTREIRVFSYALSAEVTDRYPPMTYDYRWDIATCDLDDDGMDEIVTAGGSIEIYTPLAGSNDPNLSVPAYFNGSPPHFALDTRIACADLNDDGKDDLIVAQHAPAPGIETCIDVYTYPTLPPFEFAAQEAGGAPLTTCLAFDYFDLAEYVGDDIVAGDLNNDGFAEIAISFIVGSGHVKVYHSVGHSLPGFFDAREEHYPGSPIAIGRSSNDVDCDGTDDDDNGVADDGFVSPGDCTLPADDRFCPGLSGHVECVAGALVCAAHQRTPLDGPDSDGDGLLDRWEDNGIDGDCDGIVDIDFPALRDAFPGMADRNHKDLFLELDWMTGEGPLSLVDVTQLREAFAQAPVDAGGLPNPDGLPGINLWVDTENGDALGGGSEIPASAVSRLFNHVGRATLLFPYVINDCCGVNPDPAWGCPTEMPQLDCRFDALRSQFFSDPCCTVFGQITSPHYASGYNPICPQEGDPARDCTQNHNFRELFFHYGVLAQPAVRGAVVEDGGPPGSCVDSVDQRDDGVFDWNRAGAPTFDPDCLNNPFGAEDSGLPLSCSDGTDGDAADGLDPDCDADPTLRESTGQPGVFGPPGSCTDGVDQNVFADGADAGDTTGDCAGLPAGEDGFGTGSCYDGIDNGGGDGVDGADPDCPGIPKEDPSAAADSCTNRSAANWNSLLDDDGDGLANWSDPDCAGLPREDFSPNANTCWDGIDNGDGKDFKDRSGDCFIGITGEDGSPDPKTCVDGKDNQADGADARDSDCLNVGVYDANLPEDGGTAGSCGDGVDNQADGSDFADGSGDCPTPPVEGGAGPTSCFDNRDNDADGVVDAADSDCAGVPPNMQEDGAGPGTCADDVDNMADGIDGDDGSCRFWGGLGSHPWGFLEFNHDTGTVMHELGHTLGLGHGGPGQLKIPRAGGGFDYVPQFDANANCKTNYVSVMNYQHQFEGIEQSYDPTRSEGGAAAPGSCGDALGTDEDGDGRVNAQDPECRPADVIDYSPPRRGAAPRGAKLPDMLENALSEVAILDLGDQANTISFKNARNAVVTAAVDGYDPALPEDPAVANSCGNATDDDGDGLSDRADPKCHYYDFSGDRSITPGVLSANLNDTGETTCGNTSYQELLRGADDWHHLRLAAVGTDAAPANDEVDEPLPTREEVERARWQTDLAVSLPGESLTAGLATPGVGTVEVQNLGPRVAESARATITLNGGLAFHALPSFCSASGNSALCLLGRLSANDGAAFDFAVVTTSLLPGTARSVTVSVTPYGAEDLDLANNTASVGVLALPVAVFVGGEEECTGPGGALVVLDGSGSYDPDGGSLTYHWSAPGITFTDGDTPTPSGAFPFGPTEVTLTVTNELGLSDSVTAVVEVVDHTRPRFTFVPADITSTNCSLSNIGNATGTDLCSNPVVVSKNAPAKFSPGTTTVTWKIRDQRGNEGTATQLVTLVMGDDPACCPAGTNVIQGTSNNDVLNGTSGSDCILGKGAQDTINGNGGNDYISGGAGDDIINPGLGNDVVFCGTGQDNVASSSGNDYLSGGDGDDTLSGGANDDTLYGGSGQDTLKGEDGSDRLYGDVGFDNLQGGAGSDILTGGSETDSCTDSGGGSVTAQCEGGAPNACVNGSEDGIETDVDCGGACSKCSSGFGCRSAADCVTGLFCVESSCSSF